MVKIREKQTEQLEKAASKGLKLGGWKKMTLSSKIAAVVLVLVALTAILAPLLAPYSPVEIFTARQAPGNGFIFGTDDKGRDILSRMLYGGRYSLIIGFGATAMALVCGSVVGALAAVSRKSISEAIMRILDIIMSIRVSPSQPFSFPSWAIPCRRSSLRSALCTPRRSPVSCAPTSCPSTVRTMSARSSCPAPRLRGF